MHPKHCERANIWLKASKLFIPSASSANLKSNWYQDCQHRWIWVGKKYPEIRSGQQVICPDFCIEWCHPVSFWKCVCECLEEPWAGLWCQLGLSLRRQWGLFFLFSYRGRAKSHVLFILSCFLGLLHPETLKRRVTTRPICCRYDVSVVFDVNQQRLSFVKEYGEVHFFGHYYKDQQSTNLHLPS